MLCSITEKAQKITNPLSSLKYLSSRNNAGIEQRSIFEAAVGDLLSYEYFLRREDGKALSLWTRTETHSLQELALS